MALDVSRFPQTVEVLPTILYPNVYQDNKAYSYDKARYPGQRKPSFSQLFGRKRSSTSKEPGGDGAREHYLHVHTVARVTPTMTHFVANRGPKPKLPPLEIPQPLLNISRVQSDLIFPPTSTTTRDTIKSSRLSKRSTKAALPLPTNPSIFKDSVPTFSAVSSSMLISPHSAVNNYLSGTPAGPQSMPTRRLGAINRPLPAIPTRHLSSPAPSMGTSRPFTDVGFESHKAIPLPRGNSLHAAVGEHPTRETISDPHAPGRSRGRRSSPPSIIPPAYKPSKLLRLISPQLSNEIHSRRITKHNIPVPIEQVAVSLSFATVGAAPPPIPGDDRTKCVLPPSESQPDQRISPYFSSHMSHSNSMLLGASEINDPRPCPLIVASGRHIRGPKGPRIRAAEWSRSDNARASHDRRITQKGLDSVKELEEHPASSKSKDKKFFGRGKSTSGAQENLQKGRPFLAPLNISISSINSLATPDPWAEEDRGRGTIDSGTFESDDDARSPGYSSRPESGNLIALWLSLLDEIAVTTENSQDIWKDMDFREVISQLRDLKASPIR